MLIQFSKYILLFHHSIQLARNTGLPVHTAQCTLSRSFAPFKIAHIAYIRHKDVTQFSKYWLGCQPTSITNGYYPYTARTALSFIWTSRALLSYLSAAVDTYSRLCEWTEPHSHCNIGISCAICKECATDFIQLPRSFFLLAIWRCCCWRNVIQSSQSAPSIENVHLSEFLGSCCRRHFSTNLHSNHSNSLIR